MDRFSYSKYELGSCVNVNSYPISRDGGNAIIKATIIAIYCWSFKPKMSYRYLIKIDNDNDKYYQFSLSTALLSNIMITANLKVIDNIESFDCDEKKYSWISDKYVINHCDKNLNHTEMSCIRCAMHNPYAIPNTSDGKYICYNCRN